MSGYAAVLLLLLDLSLCGAAAAAADFGYHDVLDIGAVEWVALDIYQPSQCHPCDCADVEHVADCA